MIENVEKVDEESVDSDEDNDNNEEEGANVKIHFTNESKNDIDELKNGEKTHTHLVIAA